MENVPPPEDRPGFAELGIKTEMQFDLDEERDLLHELTLNSQDSQVDDVFVAGLNHQLTTATSPMPKSRSAEDREKISSIYGARDAVFSLLGLDDPQHGLHKTLRIARTLSGCKSPSPAALIVNARLMKAMEAPVTETLRQAARFLYVAPDIAELDALESALRQHDLSIWKAPVLAAQPPQLAEPRLSHLQGLLTELRFPVTAGEVVLEDPAVLRHSEARTRLLADLAMAHASLRRYIRYTKTLPNPRGERLPLRRQLARDIGIALSYSPDMHLLGIVKYGEMGLTQAGRIKRNVGGTKPLRKELLSRLSNDGVEFLGAGIVESYLAQKPLTEDEQQEHPTLVEFSPQASPSKEASQRPEVHTGPLDEEDLPWLREVMRRHKMSSGQKVFLLERLNEAREHGSQSLRFLTPEMQDEILRHRNEFFRLFGWTLHGHPMYDSFMAYLEQGHPPSPDKVVAILRILAKPAEGQLIQIVGRANCAILRSKSPQAVQRRINIAATRAKHRKTTVGQIISEYARWFLGALPPRENE